MIIQGKLSLSQQSSGRKYWHMFNILNAASFVCVADSVLYLFALETGCPGYIIPIIASFIYVGFLAMPLGKILIAKIGATRSVTVFWASRSLFALLTAMSPFVGAWFGINAGIGALLVGALGFSVCRSAGIVAINPILGEIVPAEHRGKFTSELFRNFNLFSLLGLAAVSFAMKKYASVECFQIIIFCGVCCGFISAVIASGVPETREPRQSARAPILASLKSAWKNKVGRKLIFANIAMMSGVVLVLPISVMAVKTGYQAPNSTALICALIQFGGGILIASISGVVSRHSGPRPVILIAFALLLISSMMWITAPSEFSIFYTGLIFLLNGAAGMGTPMALTHYFLNVVPAKDRIGYSLLISMTAGTSAGICSILLGSGLLKIIPMMDYTGMEVFKIYFSVIIFLLFIFLFVLMSLEKLKDWRVGKVLGLAFAPKDLRALILLNKLDGNVTQAQEIKALERLSNTRSPMSSDKILSYLDSPKHSVRIKALLALNELPLSSKVTARLLDELKYGTYTTAPAAAMILGGKDIQEAVPLLRKCLDSENLYLIGRAMVALTQLRDEDSYELIKKIFSESDNQFILISGAEALSMMRDPDSLKLLLEKTLQDNIPRSVRAEIYSAIAEVGEIDEEFYQLFKIYLNENDLQNSYGIDFLENIHDVPLESGMVEILNKLDNSLETRREVISLLISKAKGSSRTVLKIISHFLKETHPEKIGKVLLYCLLGIYRKNGKI